MGFLIGKVGKNATKKTGKGILLLKFRAVLGEGGDSSDLNRCLTNAS